MAEPDDTVGSLGQETVKLIRAIAAERLRAAESTSGDTAESVEAESGGSEPGGAGTHVCTTGWCPICQVVGYVSDHPELVEQLTETVADAAIQVGRVVRDFLDKTIPPDK